LAKFTTFTVLKHTRPTRWRLQLPYRHNDVIVNP